MFGSPHYMVLTFLIVSSYYNPMFDNYSSLYCVVVKLFCNAVKQA